MPPKKRKRKELQMSLHPSRSEDNYTMGVLWGPDMDVIQEVQIPNLKRAAGKERKKLTTKLLPLTGTTIENNHSKPLDLVIISNHGGVNKKPNKRNGIHRIGGFSNRTPKTVKVIEKAFQNDILGEKGILTIYSCYGGQSGVNFVEKQHQKQTTGGMKAGQTLLLLSPANAPTYISKEGEAEKILVKYVGDGFNADMVKDLKENYCNTFSWVKDGVCTKVSRVKYDVQKDVFYRTTSIYDPEKREYEHPSTETWNTTNPTLLADVMKVAAGKLEDSIKRMGDTAGYSLSSQNRSLKSKLAPTMLKILEGLKKSTNNRPYDPANVNLGYCLSTYLQSTLIACPDLLYQFSKSSAAQNITNESREALTLLLDGPRYEADLILKEKKSSLGKKLEDLRDSDFTPEDFAKMGVENLDEFKKRDRAYENLQNLKGLKNQAEFELLYGIMGVDFQEKEIAPILADNFFNVIEQFKEGIYYYPNTVYELSSGYYQAMQERFDKLKSDLSATMQETTEDFQTGAFFMAAFVQLYVENYLERLEEIDVLQYHWESVLADIENLSKNYKDQLVTVNRLKKSTENPEREFLHFGKYRGLGYDVSSQLVKNGHVPMPHTQLEQVPDKESKNRILKLSRLLREGSAFLVDRLKKFQRRPRALGQANALTRTDAETLKQTPAPIEHYAHQGENKAKGPDPSIDQKADTLNTWVKTDPFLLETVHAEKLEAFAQTAASPENRASANGLIQKAYDAKNLPLLSKLIEKYRKDNTLWGRIKILDDAIQKNDFDMVLLLVSKGYPLTEKHVGLAEMLDDDLDPLSPLSTPYWNISSLIAEAYESQSNGQRPWVGLNSYVCADIFNKVDKLKELDNERLQEGVNAIFEDLKERFGQEAYKYLFNLRGEHLLDHIVTQDKINYALLDSVLNHIPLDTLDKEGSHILHRLAYTGDEEVFKKLWKNGYIRTHRPQVGELSFLYNDMRTNLAEKSLGIPTTQRQLVHTISIDLPGTGKYAYKNALHLARQGEHEELEEMLVSSFGLSYGIGDKAVALLAPHISTLEKHTKKALHLKKSKYAPTATAYADFLLKQSSLVQFKEGRITTHKEACEQTLVLLNTLKIASHSLRDAVRHHRRRYGKNVPAIMLFADRDITALLKKQDQRVIKMLLKGELSEPDIAQNHKRQTLRTDFLPNEKGEVFLLKDYLIDNELYGSLAYLVQQGTPLKIHDLLHVLQRGGIEAMLQLEKKITENNQGATLFDAIEDQKEKQALSGALLTEALKTSRANKAKISLRQGYRSFKNTGNAAIDLAARLIGKGYGYIDLDNISPITNANHIKLGQLEKLNTSHLILSPKQAAFLKANRLRQVIENHPENSPLVKYAEMSTSHPGYITRRAAKNIVGDNQKLERLENERIGLKKENNEKNQRIKNEKERASNFLGRAYNKIVLPVILPLRGVFFALKSHEVAQIYDDSQFNAISNDRDQQLEAQSRHLQLEKNHIDTDIIEEAEQVVTPLPKNTPPSTIAYYRNLSTGSYKKYPPSRRISHYLNIAWINIQYPIAFTCDLMGLFSATYMLRLRTKKYDAVQFYKRDIADFLDPDQWKESYQQRDRRKNIGYNDLIPKPRVSNQFASHTSDNDIIRRNKEYVETAKENFKIAAPDEKDAMRLAYFKAIVKMEAFKGNEHRASFDPRIIKHAKRRKKEENSTINLDLIKQHPKKRAVLGKHAFGRYHQLSLQNNLANPLGLKPRNTEASVAEQKLWLQRLAWQNNKIDAPSGTVEDLNFIKAVRDADFKNIEKQLAPGGSIAINTTTPNGYSALHYAVKNNNPQLVKILLIAGADPRGLVLVKPCPHPSNNNPEDIHPEAISQPCLDLIYHADKGWYNALGEQKSALEQLREFFNENPTFVDKPVPQNIAFIVNKKDKDGKTPLQLELQENSTTNRAFIDYLLRAGAHFTTPNTVDENSYIKSTDEEISNIADTSTVFSDPAKYVETTYETLTEDLTKQWISQHFLYTLDTDVTIDIIKKHPSSIVKALEHAITLQNTEAVNLLLQKVVGIKTIIENPQPLKTAIATGNPKFVALLINAGYNPTKLEDIPSETSEEIKTLLANAAQSWENQQNIKKELERLLLNEETSNSTWLLIPLLKNADFTHPVFNPPGEKEHLILQYIEGRAKPKRKIVAMLVKQGANPNATDAQGTTALIAAANTKKMHLLKLLIRTGADVNHKDDNGDTALSKLYTDVNHGSWHVHLWPTLRYGLKITNYYGAIAALKLWYGGQNFMLALLPKKYFSWLGLQQRNMVWLRVSTNEVRLPIFSKDTPRLGNIKLLLEVGANVTMDEVGEQLEKNTTLTKIIAKHTIAEEEGNPNLGELQKMLCDALLNPSEVNHKQFYRIAPQSIDLLNQPLQDQSRHNILISAVAQGKQEAVRLLLETKKVRLNDCGPDGKSALFYAVEGGHFTIAKMLLNAHCRFTPCARALPNKPNTEGVTPLMLAVEHGNTALTKLLISHGANINLRNNQGDSAMDIVTHKLETDEEKFGPMLDLLLSQKNAKTKFNIHHNITNLKIQKNKQEQTTQTLTHQLDDLQRLPRRAKKSTIRPMSVTNGQTEIRSRHTGGNLRRCVN